MTMTMV